MLQDAPDLGLPVVEIRVTAYDVVRAVAKAKLFGRRIGIVGFENMVLGASTLGEAMEVEIKELVLEHARDADEMVRAAIQGSIGLAAGANLNPERKYPSMFEPIHGSAPDIAGKGIANPIATIWAAAMMLDFLGYEDMGSLVISAVEQTLLKDAPKPVDLGGTASTSEMGDAVCESLYRLAG